MNPAFTNASYGTATLESFAASGFAVSPSASLSMVTVGSGGDTQPAPPQTIRVEVNDKLYNVRVFDLPQRAAAPTKNGVQRAAPRTAGKKQSAGSGGNDVVSPMHGVVVEMKVAAGDAIAEGQVVAIVEAMKMMNEIRAHRAGTAVNVHAKAGDTVEARAALVTIG